MDSGQRFVRIPFELYRDGIVLKARINHSKPILLILDTGAGQNIINERLFSELGPKPFGASHVNGGAGKTQGYAAQNASIGLPGLAVYKQLILSAPMDAMAESGRDIKGLIGTPFLQNFVIEIDYAKQVVTFYDPTVRSLSNNADAIPLTARDNIPCAAAEVWFDGKHSFSAEFFIDTGLNRIFNLSERFATEHQFFSLVPKARTTTGLGEAIGGSLTYIEARIPSIKIAGQTVRDPIASVPENSHGLYEEPGAAGLLGAELLERFTVTLDYQSQKMLLNQTRSSMSHLKLTSAVWSCERSWGVLTSLLCRRCCLAIQPRKRAYSQTTTSLPWTARPRIGWS